MADDRERLYEALRNADKAGDTAAAKRLADYIKSLPPEGGPARRSPTEAMEADPTSGMSAWQRFVAGYGKAGADIARGTGKLARDVAELVPGGERAATAIGLPTAASIAEARKLDEPLMGTTAGTVGNVAGNVIDYGALALAPGANTVAGSAALGAGAGAIQPAEGWGDRLKNMMTSGLVSGAVTGAAQAVPALWKGVVAPFTQRGQNQMALSTIDRFAENPNWQKGMEASELIPGSKRTLAEVTGDPGIAQLQRAAQAASPDTANAMALAKTGRLAARKEALLAMGTNEDKAFFEAARETTANRLYGEARRAGIDEAKAKAMQPEIKELLARPSIQSARDDAIRLAKEHGEILKPSDLKGGSINGMHWMKMALDEQIANAKPGSPLQRALMGTKDKLIGVMQNISPKYATAMAEYQAASKPINQIEVTNYLYDKLFPAISEVGAERMTPNEFVKAVKAGDEMARKATGFKGAKLTDILSPEQLTTVINLAKDVGGEVGALERAKVPGSPTAQYLAGANAMRAILGPLGLPEGWAESLLGSTFGRTIGNVATKFPFNVAERDVQGTLAHMLTEPEQAAAARQAMLARQARLAPAANAMRYALPAVSIGAGVTQGAR